MKPALELHSITIKDSSFSIFVPDEEQVEEAYAKGVIGFPYWSQIWPASIALGQFLLEHPHYTSNKNVLELGAGLGLPSLVAAVNAKHVICSDQDRDAVDAINKTIRHSKLSNMQAMIINWNEIDSLPPVDVLMLSDINYERESFEVLRNLINRYMQQGSVILLSTPQRLLSKSFIESLEPHCRRHEQTTINHKTMQVPVSVLVLDSGCPT